jgi:hypothetical protein
MGFQNKGTKTETDGYSENNGEQLHPHGVASSLARIGAREVWRVQRAKQVLVPGFRARQVFFDDFYTCSNSQNYRQFAVSGTFL